MTQQFVAGLENTAKGNVLDIQRGFLVITDESFICLATFRSFRYILDTLVLILTKAV